MAFDLIVWKWAADGEGVDLGEILDTIGGDDPHPSLTRFDIGAFRTAIRSEFGDVNEDPDGPFLYEVSDFQGVPANWVSISVSWSQVERVLPVIARIADGLGLAVFDPQEWKMIPSSAARERRSVAEVDGLRLVVENEPVVSAPSPVQLRDAINRVTPRGGPGYMILEGRGQDYAQAAGGDGVYTLEWREYAGKAFRHWTAGDPGRSDTGEAVVLTNGYQVTVRTNERLGPDDVETILLAYCEGRGRPAQFVWRDATAMFQ